jgi:hypothetical protein
MFLSGGAFLCLLTILTLDATARGGGQPIASPAPA